MNLPLLIFANMQTDFVCLDDVLKQRHQQVADFVKEKIAKRKSRQIPLDDTTNFDEVNSIIEKINNSKLNSLKLSELAKELSLHTEGNTIQELPEYKSSELAKTIKVRFNTISQSKLREIGAKTAHYTSMRNEQYLLGNKIEANAAHEKLIEINIEMIRACVYELKIDEQLLDIKDNNVIDALDSYGYLQDITNACDFFCGLPRKKQLQFGQQAQST